MKNLKHLSKISPAVNKHAAGSCLQQSMKHGYGFNSSLNLLEKAVRNRVYLDNYLFHQTLGVHVLFYEGIRSGQTGGLSPVADRRRHVVGCADLFLFASLLLPYY